MASRFALVLLTCGCASPVVLSSIDAAHLKSAADIPVVYKRSPAPYVYCPVDDGRATWETQGLNWSPDKSSPPIVGGKSGGIVLASLESSGAVRLAGDTWENIEDDWTKSLQTPPQDPAQTTASDFLALAGTAGARLPFRTAAEELTGSATGLSERFGAAPVLLFRTSDWLLVGCFFTYSPWFTVQATIFEPGSGRVLWRDSCESGFPNGSWKMGPSELNANGRALYSRVIRDRAQRCSQELFASFQRGAGALLTGSR